MLRKLLYIVYYRFSQLFVDTDNIHIVLAVVSIEEYL